MTIHRMLGLESELLRRQHHIRHFFLIGFLAFVGYTRWNLLIDPHFARLEHLDWLLQVRWLNIDQLLRHEHLDLRESVEADIGMTATHLDRRRVSLCLEHTLHV